MATASSNQPVRLPLAANPQQRGYVTSTDAKLVNMTAEKMEDGSYAVLKRAGFMPTGGSTAQLTAGGVYYWARLGGFYYVEGTNLYNSAFGVVGTVASGTYWFNETLGTPQYLYLSNGAKGYTVTSAGVFAQITDVNYPAATVPGSAFLDGTLYVMDRNAKIWGSKNLNDPTAWDALNLIVAQIEPDLGVAIAKQGSYVVAFKQWTTEFFYDAGAYNGTLTGSPLLPVQNAKLSVGCQSAPSVQNIDDVLYWVGAGKSATVKVFMMKAMKMQEISTPAIRRYLENTSYNIASSYNYSDAGHDYYVLHFGAGAALDLVYDITAGLWFELSSNGVSPTVSFAASYPNSLVGAVLQDTYGGVRYQVDYLHTHDQLQGAAASPANFPIVCEVITPLFDAGLRTKKTLSKLFVNADQNAGSSLQIRWSDDDYKTWSSWQSVNLQADAPTLTNLGTFRRRAFHLRHQTDTNFRINSIELELLYGSI